jgi:hypothetical protein
VQEMVQQQDVFTCVVHGPLPKSDFHPSCIRHRRHACRACVATRNLAYYCAARRRRGRWRSVTEDILRAAAELAEEREKGKVLGGEEYGSTVVGGMKGDGAAHPPHNACIPSSSTPPSLLSHSLTNGGGWIGCGCTRPTARRASG